MTQQHRIKKESVKQSFDGVLSFRSTFGRSTGHNSISSIGSTNISEGSIRSTNSIAKKFNKIYQG